MDYLTCPDDEVQLKVIEVRWGPDSCPLLRCPQCAKEFAFTRTGLVAITGPAQ